VSVLPLVLALTTPADGGDWWWVQGDPQDAAMTFADARSVTRDGARATVRTVTIDRTGQALPQVMTFTCPAPPREGPHRFACDSDEERMSWAAMLGPLSPSEAARALFASGETDARTLRAD
jgi:hypothetical protein